LYEGAHLNRYTNAIAGAVVEATTRSWRAERPLRILEVGGGTGGTSTTLLPLLDSENTEYIFTDVSDLFLTRARQKFAAFPFVSFATFDLEKGSETQGFSPNSFDIIVGANVVHAARNLDAALTKMGSLLVPGGFLLLVEVTHHHDWFDFTTGLIEGWQHFSDDWRGDNPLLKPDQWKSALLQRGFVEVAAFPDAGSPAEVLGQHVILARTQPNGTAESVATGNLSVQLRSGNEAEKAASPDASYLFAVEMERFRQRLEAAVPDERAELMEDYVRSRTLEVLRLDSGRRLDRRHRLMDLGLDSLMAVQLRNLLESGLGIGHMLPATLIFDYPTIGEIATFLLQSIIHEDLAAPHTAVAEERNEDFATTRVREVEALSDEEAEARLMKLLERN
jgi:SAM-dependent methyltransferase